MTRLKLRTLCKGKGKALKEMIVVIVTAGLDSGSGTGAGWKLVTDQVGENQLSFQCQVKGRTSNWRGRALGRQVLVPH